VRLVLLVLVEAVESDPLVVGVDPVDTCRQLGPNGETGGAGATGMSSTCTVVRGRLGAGCGAGTSTGAGASTTGIGGWGTSGAAGACSMSGRSNCHEIDGEASGAGAAIAAETPANWPATRATARATVTAARRDGTPAFTTRARCPLLSPVKGGL